MILNSAPSTYFNWSVPAHGRGRKRLPFKTPRAITTLSGYERARGADEVAVDQANAIAPHPG